MSNKSLKFVAITPHPPIIIPSIGGSNLARVQKTIKAMEKLAEIFAKAKPDTVLVISPHGSVDFNYFTINNSPTLTGHFYNFGDFQTELILKNDLEIISLIEKECLTLKIPLRKSEIKELDHGTLVPLYYLARHHANFKVVPLAYSFLDLKTHFKFGKILQKTIEQFKNKNLPRSARQNLDFGKEENMYSENKRIGIVASGDLSHCLTADALGGYSPRGKEFDEKLIELLKNKDVEGILNMDPDLVEEAGECGYRSIIILLGALNDLDWHSEILSYEGPFGVGYLVANFKL